MLQGDTRNLPLSNLFQTLALNQQEGVLSITFDKFERCLAIRANEVYLCCERPYTSSLLPTALARLGILTEAEFQNVFSTASNAQAPGDILSERHLVNPDLIFGPIREQLLESIFEAFEWVGARYKFEVRPLEAQELIFAHPETLASMSLPVNSVLMEVARREDEWDRIRAEVADPTQIYALTSGPEHYQAFQSPDGLDAERTSALVQSFDGEHTLQEILNTSRIPEFYVYSTLRALHEQNLVAPIGLDEKRVLAEKLRNKFQLDRVAEVYKSILAESPEQVDIRRKLVLHLERKKVPATDLVEQYHALALHARQQGLEEDELEQLEKIRNADPDDIEALAQIARIALDSGDDREWTRNLGALIEAAQRTEAFAKTAGHLIRFCEVRREDVPLLTQTAQFLFLAGEKNRAGQIYVVLANRLQSTGDLPQLERIVEKLEQCDVPTEPWAEALSQRAAPKVKKESRRLGRLVRSAALVLFVFGVSGLAVAELMAWSARAEASKAALSLAELGQIDQAYEKLRDHRGAYSFSLFSADTRSAERDVQRLAEESQKAAARSKNTSPEAAEALLSRAATLSQRGDYSSALELYEQVEVASLSKTAADTVSRERERLTHYLQEAENIALAVDQATRRGDIAAANRASRRLLYDYAFSAEARDLRVPVRIRVTPRDATVVVQGVVVNGPPYVVRVRPTESLVVQATHPGFENWGTTVDPLESFDLVAHLQRKSDHVIPLDAALESSPVVLGNSVVAGPRSGRLQSFSLADGSSTWSKPLENLGDVLGAVRVYGQDLFFLGTDGAVYRFAANGRKNWRQKIPEALGYPGRPLSAGTALGHCFLSTKRGRVAAISLDSGSVTWHRTLTSGALSLPVVAGERVVAVDRQGRVYCVNAKTGEPDWKADVHGEVVVEPVVAGDRVLIATTDGRLVALHLERGEELWSENLEEPLRVAPVAVVGEYLAITQSGRLTIGALADGRARLAAQVPGRFTVSRPAADGRHGYLVDDEGHVLALRLADASQSWSYHCGGTPGGNLVVADGRLILGAVDRGLHVLTLDSEAEPNR